MDADHPVYFSSDPHRKILAAGGVFRAGGRTGAFFMPEYPLRCRPFLFVQKKRLKHLQVRILRRGQDRAFRETAFFSRIILQDLIGDDIPLQKLQELPGGDLHDLLPAARFLQELVRVEKDLGPVCGQGG